MSKILEVKILPTGNFRSKKMTKFKFYSFLDQQLNWKKTWTLQANISNQIPTPLTNNWLASNKVAMLFYLLIRNIISASQTVIRIKSMMCIKVLDF